MPKNYILVRGVLYIIIGLIYSPPNQEQKNAKYMYKILKKEENEVAHIRFNHMNLPRYTSESHTNIL